jgi:hypothetical protein
VPRRSSKLGIVRLDEGFDRAEPGLSSIGLAAVEVVAGVTCPTTALAAVAWPGPGAHAIRVARPPPARGPGSQTNPGSQPSAPSGAASVAWGRESLSPEAPDRTDRSDGAASVAREPG